MQRQSRAERIVHEAVLFLRVASILTLIHAVLHTIGGVFGHIDPGAASVAVEAMKVNTFPASSM
jgi:hypothetical protein